MSPNAGLLPISFVPPGRGSGKGKQQQQSGFDAGDQRRLPKLEPSIPAHASQQKKEMSTLIFCIDLHQSSSLPRFRQLSRRTHCCKAVTYDRDLGLGIQPNQMLAGHFDNLWHEE